MIESNKIVITYLDDTNKELPLDGLHRVIHTIKEETKILRIVDLFPSKSKKVKSIYLEIVDNKSNIKKMDYYIEDTIICTFNMNDSFSITYNITCNIVEEKGVLEDVRILEK